jgi:hypothetical protein
MLHERKLGQAAELIGAEMKINKKIEKWLRRQYLAKPLN